MTNEVLGQDDLKKFEDFDGHHKVVRVHDGESGLTGFIAVHNAQLGPALGGCRMVKYASEAEALRDVLRLSRGMTYKNALAGLPLGGGKSVIIGDPYKDKTESMMHAMGRAVHALGGLYIAAEDSGTAEKDMEIMASETPYVAGIAGHGAGELGGNPSPITAWGVYRGMKAAAHKKYGHDDLGKLTVAVQGLGAVGYTLCRLLHNDGAKIIATDIRETVAEQGRRELGLQIVGSDDIFTVPAHIFAPCALGAQLNDKTIPVLKAAIVAGAANNQLAAARHEQELAKRGILYVPDYVLNAGGVIAVAYEYFARGGHNPFSNPLSRETMMVHVERIGPTVTRIFNIADARNTLAGHAAAEMAEGIFRSATGGQKATG